jgi:hypothetical protein
MALYRKKPVVIEAMQNDGTFGRINRICAWAARNGWGDKMSAERGDGELARYTLFITTLEGTMEAPPSAWVIKGVKGEFYPCAADVFDATYDPVEGEATHEPA